MSLQGTNSNVERDVLREKERQARARALLIEDNHDHTSSQPIFGEPIKVVPRLEDETSRRIRRTLGDFNQVQPYLTKDPTHLIGISKTVATGVSNTAVDRNGKETGCDPIRQSPSSSNSNLARSVPTDNPCAVNESLTSTNSSLLKRDQKSTTPIVSSQHHRSKKCAQQDQREEVVPKIPSDSYKSTAKAVKDIDDLMRTTSSQPTITAHHRNTGNVPMSSSTTKLCTSTPCQATDREKVRHNKQNHFKLNHTTHQVDVKNKKHPEVESILREMKQVVPPPLTTIATPPKEEQVLGFSPLRERVLSPPPNSQEETSNKQEKERSTTSSYSAISLHKDLEVSDSEEETVPNVKKVQRQLGSDRSASSEILYPPSPLEAMSSSSENSSSDSDNSSSGSDSEESNVSGRVSPESPEKFSTQSWGLANFVEKKSTPALAPLKEFNSINHEEQHLILNNSQNITMDLADEDSVNCILGKFSNNDIKDYLQSPSPHLMDFDSGALPLSHEVQALLSPVPSSPIPRQEEQVESEDELWGRHLIDREDQKSRGQDQKSFDQDLAWSEDDEEDREIRNYFPEQLQNVKIKINLGNKEKKQDAAELKENTKKVYDQYCASIYSTPEVSSSTALKADCTTVTVSKCIQSSKSSVYVSSCHRSDGNKSSNNVESHSLLVNSGQEKVRKKSDNRKPVKSNETLKKHISYGHSSKSGSKKEEKVRKTSEDRKSSNDHLVVKPESAHLEKKPCDSHKAEKFEKKTASKIKSKPIVSDTSSSEESELDTFQGSLPRVRKNVKKTSHTLSSKTSSTESLSMSSKCPEKVRSKDSPIFPKKCSSSSHITDVINRVARGDSSCRNICLDSERHLPPSWTDRVPTSLTKFNDDTPVKMDPPKLLSPIRNGSTPKAHKELKENAIPCVFVSIDLALINRVPDYPPIDRTKSLEQPGKVKSQDPIRPSPREHLKEIKQDSNRTSIFSNPVSESVSPVKKKKKKSLQLASKPHKRRAEENKVENGKKHKMSASTTVEFPEPQATGKQVQLDGDHLWEYTTPKSVEQCDSPSSLSVCSYSSHKSALSVSSRRKVYEKDTKEQSIKKSKSKEKTSEHKSESKTTLPLSSEQKSKTKEKQRLKGKEPDSKVQEKYRSNSTESKKFRSSAVKGIAPNSPSQKTKCIWEEEVPHFRSDDQEKNEKSNSRASTVHALEYGHRERERPLFEHKLYLDHDSKHYSSDNYLNEAKELKHQADKEVDRTVQAMKYLEAVLYFTLTGNAMEHNCVDGDKVYTMYKETLGLIRHISSNFQKCQHSSNYGNIDRRLAVLSLRCQSLLYLKLYRLKRVEVRELHKSLNDFQKSPASQMVSHPSPLPPSNYTPNPSSRFSYPSPCHSRSYGGSGANGVPSPHSPTPSPAGSVGSQSSGYSSSELNGRCNTVQSGNCHNSHSISGPSHLSSTHYHSTVGVPQNMYSMMQKQNIHLTNLHMCLDLWEQADFLIEHSGSREFFSALDKSCGHLTLHSSFSDLVRYVRAGLYRLKEGT
ncbi:AF4/FMR2 family member 4-like [Limulus polyphemus]|uniref:AF4/FMR2 family member lilli n=1 Tax=Limulus polyphemus TaxID=6850 RepID=A0ABM1B5N1_LIMPO|nr:AF4/FMR2 family member 4-like [Limulus polyphemus]